MVSASPSAEAIPNTVGKCAVWLACAASLDTCSNKVTKRCMVSVQKMVAALSAC